MRLEHALSGKSIARAGGIGPWPVASVCDKA